MSFQKSSLETNRQTFSEEFGSWIRLAFHVGVAIKNWLLSAPRVWLTILVVFLALVLFGNRLATQVFGLVYLANAQSLGDLAIR